METMKPTIKILKKLNENSKKNKEKVFTRLFRYILRKDIFFILNHNSTDSLNEKKIELIINKLKNGNYKPHPARKKSLSKKNENKNCSEVDTSTDKLIQEVLKMILESIYEPIFTKYSYKFRRNINIHKALSTVKNEFVNTKWFIQGDIRDAFDNINYSVLLKIINKKIKDKKLTDLIQSFLNAGYMGSWKYNREYNGIPQGEIISSILENIYLHEMDMYVEKLQSQYNEKHVGRQIQKYKIKRHRDLNKKNLETIEKINIKQLKRRRRILEIDMEIKYIRCGNNFLIGVNGNLDYCKYIKRKLLNFIINDLDMKVNENKILIAHSSNGVRFLAYDIKIRHNTEIKKADGLKNIRLKLKNTIELMIPIDEKITSYLFNKKIIIQTKDGKIKPCRRPQILFKTDLEIINIYNSEIYAVCSYYKIASNYKKLSYFGHLMECSCLHTLANKHKTRTSKIYKKYKKGKGRWGVSYNTKEGAQIIYFAKYNDRKILYNN